MLQTLRPSADGVNLRGADHLLEEPDTRPSSSLMRQAGKGDA